MNEHKSFNKCIDEMMKRLLNFCIKVEEFVLLFIFIVFEQFH